MKFTYIDESGMGEEPISVMTGIIVDTDRMNKTKTHWKELLNELTKIAGKNVREVHTKDLYSGHSPFNRIEGKERKEIINKIFDWLKYRKHDVVYTALDKNNYKEKKESNDEAVKSLGSKWKFMGTHIALSLQKEYQGSKRNKSKRRENPKGYNLMVFDQKEEEKKNFTELILNPPEWTDDYYEKLTKQEKLSQIIDVPHFVDSKQVGLIQLADFISYFFRRNLEVINGYEKERYAGEARDLKRWNTIMFERSLRESVIFKKRGKNHADKIFSECSPERLI